MTKLTWYGHYIHAYKLQDRLLMSEISADGSHFSKSQCNASNITFHESSLGNYRPALRPNEKFPYMVCQNTVWWNLCTQARDYLTCEHTAFMSRWQRCRPRHHLEGDCDSFSQRWCHHSATREDEGTPIRSGCLSLWEPKDWMCCWRCEVCVSVGVDSNISLTFNHISFEGEMIHIPLLPHKKSSSLTHRHKLVRSEATYAIIANSLMAFRLHVWNWNI